MLGETALEGLVVAEDDEVVEHAEQEHSHICIAHSDMAGALQAEHLEVGPQVQLRLPDTPGGQEYNLEAALMCLVA